MNKEKIFNISSIHQQYWKEFCDVCYSRFGFEDGEERTYEQKYETFCRCKGYIVEDNDYELELLHVREIDLQRLKMLSEWFFSIDDGKDILPALYNFVRMMWSVGRNLEDDALLIKYICPRKPKVNYSSYRLDATKRLDKNIHNNSNLREIVRAKTDSAILEDLLGDESYYRTVVDRQIVENDYNGDTIEWNPADGTIIPIVNQILEAQVPYFNDKLDDFIDALPSGTECPRGSELQAFLYRLFMSFEDSLSEVKEELEELPSPMNLEELQQESRNLIHEFRETPLGERWAKCIVCEGGLKHFANYFMHHRKDFTEEEEHRFFFTLDKICMIEDILQGKADKYWLELEYPNGWLDKINAGSFNHSSVDGIVVEGDLTIEHLDFTFGKGVTSASGIHRADSWQEEAEIQDAEVTAPKPSNFALLITRESQREHVLNVLHDVMRGKKGKAAALVMKCAREAGLIVDLPSWTVATEEFGDIGCQRNFEKYLSFLFTDEEKSAFIDLLKR